MLFKMIINIMLYNGIYVIFIYKIGWWWGINFKNIVYVYIVINYINEVNMYVSIKVLCLWV